MRIQLVLSVIFIAICLSTTGGTQINHCPSICHSWPIRARYECLTRTFHCETSRCGYTGLQCGPKATQTPAVTAEPSKTSSPSPTPSSSSSPSPTPSVSPTPSSSPSPTPSTSPLPTPASGQCTGDPHCRTFDGVHFDCQARGEFILARTDGSPHFVLQGRFSDTPHHPSVSTGVVMVEQHAPLIQISVPRLAKTKRQMMGGCPVTFFINANNRLFPKGTHQIGQGSRTRMVVSNDGVEVNLPSGIRVFITVRHSSTWGCMFNLVQNIIPGTVIAKTSITGLLGSPNGNRNDDWSTPGGLPVRIPSNSRDLRGPIAYHYCAENWGISRMEDSLFTYEFTDEEYEYLKQLKDPAKPVPDLNNAPQEVKDLCAGNDDCVMDGLVGGLEAAEILLEAEEAAMDELDDPIIMSPPSSAPVRALDMDDGKDYKKRYLYYHSN